MFPGHSGGPCTYQKGNRPCGAHLSKSRHDLGVPAKKRSCFWFEPPRHPPLHRALVDTSTRSTKHHRHEELLARARFSVSHGLPSPDSFVRRKSRRDYIGPRRSEYSSSARPSSTEATGPASTKGCTPDGPFLSVACRPGS